MKDKTTGYQVLEEGKEYQMWDTCIIIPVVDIIEKKVKILKTQ